MANNWQQNTSTLGQGDLNGDGIVDIRDLQVIANNWQAGVGGGGGSGTEGSSTADVTPTIQPRRKRELCACGGGSLALRRRRRLVIPIMTAIWLKHHFVKKWKIVLSKISVSH